MYYIAFESANSGRIGSVLRHCGRRVRYQLVDVGDRQQRGHDRPTGGYSRDGQLSGWASDASGPERSAELRSRRAESGLLKIGAHGDDCMLRIGLAAWIR